MKSARGTDGGALPTARRAWAPGARLTLARVHPPHPDLLAASPARGVASAAAYRLRNRLQRDLGHLRRLLDGADLADPAIRRRVRVGVARMVQAILDAVICGSASN